MMKANEQFFRVRYTAEGDYLFSVRDVCDAVGVSNPNKILTQIGIARKIYIPCASNGGTQNMRFITKAELQKLLGHLHGRYRRATPVKDYFEQSAFPLLAAPALKTLHDFLNLIIPVEPDIREKRISKR